MVSKAESEAQEERLSELESLLAVVGLEVTTEGIRTGTEIEGEIAGESSIFWGLQR